MLMPNSATFVSGGPKGPAHAPIYPQELGPSFQDLRVFAEGGHPFALYARLREEAPVYWHPEGDPTEPASGR